MASMIASTISAIPSHTVARRHTGTGEFRSDRTSTGRSNSASSSAVVAGATSMIGPLLSIPRPMAMPKTAVTFQEPLPR